MVNTKVLLVNLDLGYPIDIWPTKKQSIGLGYIGAVLETKGHEVDLLEERFVGKHKIFKVLTEEAYDVAGFSFTGFEMSKSYIEANTLLEAFNNPVTEAIKLVKSTHPETKIVLGGYSATFWDEEILYLLPVDAICRNEAEISILELLSAIEANTSYTKVSGISWIKDGKIYRTPVKLPDIEKLPRPLRLPHEPEDWIMVNTSRGCYNRCTFCSTFASYGEPKGCWWRGRSASSVVRELEELVAQRYRNFQFADDTFIGSQPERAKAIAKGIIKRGIDCSLRFDCGSREVKPEIFELLQKAGLKRVYLGCESGSKKDLQLFRKNTTIEQNIWAVKTLRSLGIEVNPGLIMFHPLSDVETIEDNIRYLDRLGGDPTIFELTSELIVYKGTPIYRELSKKGLLNLPLTTYKIVDPLVRWIKEEFFRYANKEYAKIKQILDTPYRKGDHLRKAVYQQSSEHFQIFKEIVAEAKKQF